MSERISTKTLSPSQRHYFEDEVWPALINAVAVTFGRFEPNKRTRKIYHKFGRNLLRSRDVVISFNYDTILENSLSTRWHYGVLKEEKTIPIFKPHGSINWGLNANQIRVYKTTQSQPVLIAPTHLKFIRLNNQSSHTLVGLFDQSPQIENIWKQMELEMRKSKAFVFIGYSFPDADLYFSSVLRSVFSSLEKSVLIVLVNPNY